MKTDVQRAWPVDGSYLGRSGISACYMSNENRFACLGMTENFIFIVPAETFRPHNPVKSLQITIPFFDVKDIFISADKATGQPDDSHAMEWILTIHYKGGIIDLRLHESCTAHKKIEAAWFSSLVRKSVGTGDVTSDSDSYIAQQYLEETIKSIQSTKDNKEIQQIFNEFSEECFLDLNLKSATLKSRELFAISMGLIRRCSGKLTRGEKFSLGKKHEKESFQDMKSKGRSDSPQRIESERERHENLRTIAFRRLEMIQSCLQVILSALFSSDIIDDKVSLFLGPA
jgi:hypothetical protein